MSDGTTQRANLEALERRLKRRPPELDGPELPVYLMPAWLAFLSLHNKRSSNGFGMNPISWTEIAAWISVQQRGVAPSDWMIDAIMALDHEFLVVMGEQESKKAKSRQKASAAKG